MKIISDKYAPQERYKKKMMKMYGFMCHIQNDEDIIKALEKCENKSELIKTSIREHIANEKNK